MFLRLFLLGLIGLGSVLHAATPSPPPVPVIFDTDMETDCDDAGAMAVLHALADAGECKILATVVSVRDPNSARTVDAINRYRGRPELPVGMVKGTVGVLEKTLFAGKIAGEFPHRFREGAEVPDAVQVYREVLEKAERPVVVVTVGYLTNLRGLLELPAEGGRLSGVELIRAKVEKWVCMGGNFVGDPPQDDLKLGNVNFQRDAASARAVIPRWPGKVVFVGREIGSVPSGLQLGVSLAGTPVDNPVRRAYEHYFGGKLKNRHVADLVTVLYAVRGHEAYWDLGSAGTMDLQPEMKFTWRPEAQGRQIYLKKRTVDGRPNDWAIEEVLNELVTRPVKR